MSENLKVNENTNISEFKRKHNRLVDKSDLSSQDVKVKTIEQSQANYVAEISEFMPVTNCTSTPIFCRVQQINKELHIIILGKIHNDTESDIAVYSTGATWITLPEVISEKIYDVLGHTAKEVVDSVTRISVNYASVYGNDEVGISMANYISDCVMTISNVTQANKIAIGFSRPSAITLKAGKDTYFESRVSLDLI